MRHDMIINQLTLQGERLVLRPLRKSDAGLIGLYANDRRVAEMTTVLPHPLPPGISELLIARAAREDRTEDFWAIDASGIGGAEVAGLISLARLSRSQSEIGYWIAPAFWNLGYASEALGLLIAANPHGDETIFASVFQDNPASARVLTRAGFVYLGDAEAFAPARGANVPTWTYLLRLAAGARSR